MAEFKPRGSSEDEDEDNISPIENWLSNLFDEEPDTDQEASADSKKKSRFNKLFQPVFRMIFPRSEKPANKIQESESVKDNSFIENILGADTEKTGEKDNNIVDYDNDFRVMSPDDQNVVDETEHDIPKITEEGEVDIEEAVVQEFSEENEPKEGRYVPLNVIAQTESGDSAKSTNTQEVVSTPSYEKPSTSGALVGILATDMLSRRRDKKLEKQQKKIDKKVKEQAKKIDSQKFKYDKNINEVKQELEKQKREIETVNDRSKEFEEKTSKEIHEPIPVINIKHDQTPINSVDQISERSKEAPIILPIEGVKSREERSKIEKKEIERIIGESLSSEKVAEKKQKTERYFERKHEIKDEKGLKGIQHISQNDLFGHTANSHTVKSSQQLVSSDIHSANKYKHMPNKTQHKAAKSTQVSGLGVVILGVILSIIIIAVFFL